MNLQPPVPSLIRGHVARIVLETPHCRSLEIDLPAEHRAAFAARPGQFTTIEAVIDGVAHRRCYSLSSLACLGEKPRFTVKRVAGGKVSNWCHDALREGSEIAVAEPLGRFVLQDGDAPILFAAAGSGITPIYAMLRDALLNTARRLTLLFVNRSSAQAIFAPELRTLAERHADRFGLVEVFTETAHSFPTILAELLAREKSAELYLCGPAGFMQAVEQAARLAGIADDRIFVERFSQDGAGADMTAPVAAATPADVTVRIAGSEQNFPCRPDQTLLEAGLAAGLGLPSSCRQGHCGACMVRLLQGDVHGESTSGLSRRDRQKGYILACQAKPASHSIRLSYEI